MERVLERLPSGSRVAIIRLRSLGDCVLTTPALAILDRFRPDLRVAVVVEDRFRAIFHEQALPPSLAALRRFRPDLCLNLHGGTRSAWLTALSGARYRAGFAHFRHQFPYNIHIPRAQEILGVDRKVHTAEHLASAIFYLGAPPAPIGAATVRERYPRNPVASTPAPRAVIHPVATRPDKTWPPDKFLSVAEHLKTCGIEPVFIGAAADDLTPFAAFRIIRGAPLEEIQSLLTGASLFIGNDSGPAHMAAAAGLPVIAIFIASDPEIWGPWRTTSEVLTGPRVTVAEVLEALARMRVHA